jgi:hypothetical protein
MAVAPTEKSGGTQNVAALDTIYTLLDTSDAGIYELHLDLNPLAAEDVLVARFRSEVRSGGTERLIREVEIPNAQYEQHWKSEPFACIVGIKIEIEQTDGVDALGNVVWSVVTW